MSVTVCCVLRSGGPTYTPEWVYALKRGLNRHLPDFEFRVLSDLDCFGQWGSRLLHGWPKWWAKLELFRPGLFTGRVLYLDLDTLVVGDLGQVAAYAGPFAMLSDFYRPAIAASGVMAWGGDELAAVYDAFRADPAGILRRNPGRMDHWLGRVAPKPIRLQERFPGRIVSYKRDALEGPPEGACLVAGHGRPRFSEPKTGWAHRAWKAVA